MRSDGSTNRVAVVTGASAGVGRAVAVAFAKAGWSVGLLARGAEGLAGAQREVEAAGGRALAFTVDVADALALQRAAACIERELGPIGVWVNNAMVTIYVSSVDVEPSEWEQVTRVTYLGQVYGALAALRHMRPRGQGTIVFIGSALAYRSIPFQGPYCAAKSAVRGFVDSLRSELLWEGSGVRLTMVHLPAVNTPQFDWARNKFRRKLAPVPPIYQPETVAAAVLRAAHEAPREYWLGVSAVKAIVAQMVAPSIADRYLARGGKANETTNQPAEEKRPDNLFGAGLADPGAHGRFDARSRGHAINLSREQTARFRPKSDVAPGRHCARSVGSRSCQSRHPRADIPSVGNGSCLPVHERIAPVVIDLADDSSKVVCSSARGMATCSRMSNRAAFVATCRQTLSRVSTAVTCRFEPRS